MSFEHSVIIPYKLYQKCNLEESSSAAALDILTDATLPSDQKLKLYNQALLSSTTTTPPLPVKKKKRNNTTTASEHILHNFPDKDKPVVSSILSIIDQNPSRLNYKDDMRVILNGDPIPDSNLINILLFLTNNLTVTSDKDIPSGSKKVYAELLSIGMPDVWIKPKRLKRRTTPARSKKRRLEEDRSEDPLAATRWEIVKF